MLSRTLYCSCSVVLFLAPVSALAHPISLSASIVDCRKGMVRAEITIMLEDLVLYQRLIAKNGMRFPAALLKQAAKKHEAFLLRYFVVRDQRGKALTGRVTGRDEAQIPAGGVTAVELKSKSVVYQIEFPLSQPPEFVTITQTFGGANAVLPAVMDCMILQQGALLEPSEQLLGGKPFTVRLDWKNPPQNKRNWRALKAEREKERKRRLGIASYGGLYSFIYITPQSIRHELLTPLLTFETWLPIQRRTKDFLTVDEQAAAKKRVADFFRREAVISVDGRRVVPRLARLNFFALDIRDFAGNAKPRDVSVHQARLGVILDYPIESSIRVVDFTWRRFNRAAPFLKSAILIDREPPRSFTFTKEQTKFSWSVPPARNVPMVVPVKTGIRGLRSKPDNQLASQIAEGLLGNIYRSFQRHNESDTYDALATTIAGELLREVYLQTRRSLAMAEQGGARARVDKIQVVSTVVEAQSSSRKFSCRCRWNVTGTVEHWGHVHTRQNQYEARLSVENQGGAWKLTGFRVQSQRRIGFRTTLRE